MGLNAYFTYQVVGWHGTGEVPYKIALTAIFVEGFIFVFLALTGMRQWLVRMIPATIKTACGVGIGLFLTEIGLSYSAGIGAITGGFSTPLAIGGCPPEYLDSKGECSSHIMTNPSVSVSILAHMVSLPLIVGTDVDWHLPRRYFCRFYDGFQGQECHCHWYWNRVYHVLAVSIVPGA